jgi:hypothetical protein
MRLSDNPSSIHAMPGFALLKANADRGHRSVRRRSLRILLGRGELLKKSVSFLLTRSKVMTS